MNRLLSVAALALLFTVVSFAQNTPNIDKREKRQQARIDQGVKSGELNKREAARLERQQARLNNNEAKAKADGVVTPKERAHLQHEANRTSRHIYKQKHDAQKRK